MQLVAGTFAGCASVAQVHLDLNAAASPMKTGLFLHSCVTFVVSFVNRRMSFHDTALHGTARHCTTIVGSYVRELPAPSSTDVSKGSEPALSLGVSYDEGGEGLGDPSQVAQVRGSSTVCPRDDGEGGDANCKAFWDAIWDDWKDDEVQLYCIAHVMPCYAIPYHFSRRYGCMCMWHW